MCLLSVFKATNLENRLGLCPGVLGWRLTGGSGMPRSTFRRKAQPGRVPRNHCSPGTLALSLSPAMLDAAGPVTQVGPAVETGAGSI